MAYTTRVEKHGQIDNQLAITYYSSGTGSNFTITPRMRVSRVILENVTDGGWDTTASDSSGTWTITPATANDTIRTTFVGVS